MPPLSALQAGLRRAVLAGDLRAAAEAVRADGLSAAQRLRIHANHYTITLGEALAATFPVTRQLVGERCFAVLAREFAALAPPASPCLFEYGAGFPRYLAAVPTLMTLPYLPDVARLEWVMNEARHAADAPRLPIEALAPLQDACFSEVVFTLHPAVRLLASPFPVERIWRLNQPDADPDARVSLDEGVTRLLINRDKDDDVSWCSLSEGEFAFVTALAGTVPLGAAWSRASRADAWFDGGRALSGLIAAGVFADFRFPVRLI